MKTICSQLTVGAGLIASILGFLPVAADAQLAYSSDDERTQLAASVWLPLFEEHEIEFDIFEISEVASVLLPIVEPEPPTEPVGQLIRQEFSGQFDLIHVDHFSWWNFGDEQSFLLDQVDYLGFIEVYENGFLEDWQINIAALRLDFSPASFYSWERMGGNGAVMRWVSPSEWNLLMDFGMAIDAPGYSLSRDDSGLTFRRMGSFAGGYSYQDDAPSIAQTFPDDSKAVPEPGVVLGLLILGGTGTIAKLTSNLIKCL